MTSTSILSDPDLSTRDATAVTQPAMRPTTGAPGFSPFPGRPAAAELCPRHGAPLDSAGHCHCPIGPLCAVHGTELLDDGSCVPCEFGWPASGAPASGDLR